MKFKVTARPHLRVRSAPGTQYDILGTVATGVEVTQVERRRPHGEEHDWIRAEPVSGWLRTDYLTPVVDVEAPVARPHGLAALRATFGEACTPACSSGRVTLPSPLKLGWSPQEVRVVACHEKMVPVFTAVFNNIYEAGLWSLLKTFDGIYNCRSTRGGTKHSTHAWGIAVDLNAATNRMGAPGDMDPRIIRIFLRHGFVWGGDWTGSKKDPMHFQYVNGY